MMERVMLAGWREGEKIAWVGGLLPFYPCGVHFSLTLSHPPPPLLCFFLCNWEKWGGCVCMCARMWKLHYPHWEGALLQKTNRKIQGHHGTLLTLPLSPLLCACVQACLCVCLRGRESVCNSLHQARLCTNHGAHFSSKHTCRHLSQSVCVFVCVLSASRHSSVSCLSDWRRIKET